MKQILLLLTLWGSANAQSYHVGDTVLVNNNKVAVDKIFLGTDNAHFLYADSISNPPPYDALILFSDGSYASTISPVSIGNWAEIAPLTATSTSTVAPPALVMNPFYSGMPVVVYSQRVYRGMTYFIMAQTGHGNFPGGLTTINLTLDSLQIAYYKKQLQPALKPDHKRPKHSDK